MTASFRQNPWLCRGIFLLANLAACNIAVALVVFPISALLSDRDTQIVEQQRLLARLSSVAAQEKAIQDLLARNESAKDRPEFLRGPNQGVITADLQTRLTGVVQAAGGHLRSIRSIPPKTVDGITFVGAQVDLSGPLRAVHQAVVSIEGATPYLFIVGAAIKPSAQFNIPGRGSDSAAAPILDARLDVIGALQPEGRD